MLTVYIILGFLVVFPLFWIGIIQIIALLSGWKTLASLYRTDQAAPNNTRYGISGMMGISGYNGVLNLGFNHQGLYLSVMVLFSIGQAPVLVPWSGIEKIEPASWLFYGNVYRIRTWEGVKIMVPAKYLEGIEQYYPPREVG